MDNNWNTVNVLRYARHDWLNKIQLIKGNLSLNRLERAQDIIDEIVMEAQQEARLSNLQLPHFAALLLVTNWNNYYFRLEYEVLGDIQSVKMDDTQLTNWTSSLFMTLNSCIEAFQENHLSISILPHENGVQFFFDFTGTIVKPKEIEVFLKDSHECVKIKDISESELSFELNWEIT
ncbi:Spo0B C-terminal domain-containing protein [Bacillus sp. CGMCC 1.16607]|uniref:Spo0B C-terminal domain-containing protein n=1 Tax=Bacillus sp. CGMCC 1.16607 TaxID=3351842 RepID=UPI00363923B5